VQTWWASHLSVPARVCGRLLPLLQPCGWCEDNKYLQLMANKSIRPPPSLTTQVYK
jgi:hypothetical protein